MYMYAHVDTTTGHVYIMLEARLEALFKKEEEYAILEKMKGSTLVGRKYRPLFPYFQHLKSEHPGQGAFRIVRLGGRGWPGGLLYWSGLVGQIIYHN